MSNVPDFAGAIYSMNELGWNALFKDSEGNWFIMGACLVSGYPDRRLVSVMYPKLQKHLVHPLFKQVFIQRISEGLKVHALDGKVNYNEETQTFKYVTIIQED